MSMMAALKAAQKQAPTNVVNADVRVVEEIDGRSVVVRDDAPRATGPRPKFRPVDPATLPPAPEPEAPRSPSNNYDLVGDDVGASPEQQQENRRAGRKRLFASNAEKQRAYRERKQKQGG